MSIFRNKILTKIIAALCICLTLMNFGQPCKVYADWGGVLITPVTKLLTSIADGIIGILHDTIQLQKVSLVRIAGEPEWWRKYGENAMIAIITAVIVVVVGAVVLAVGGWAYLSGVLLIKSIGSAIAVATIAALAAKGFELVAGESLAVYLTEVFAEAVFPDSIDMPAFTITPEYIFANKVHLFDINFFKPMEDEITTTTQNQVVVAEQEPTSNNGDVDHFERTFAIYYIDGDMDSVLADDTKAKNYGTKITEKNENKYENLMSTLQGYISNTYTVNEMLGYMKEGNYTQLKEILDYIDEALIKEGKKKIDRSKADAYYPKMYGSRKSTVSVAIYRSSSR